MECERLKKQIKNWYAQVQDEAMAPARMVDFMRKHVDECTTCLIDPIVEMEINRITEIVLPPSKIPKAVRKEEGKEAPRTPIRKWLIRTRKTPVKMMMISRTMTMTVKRTLTRITMTTKFKN